MTSMSTRTILIGLLLIAGLYLLVDHRTHVIPYLPFTFLLGCLFMHFFMHGSQGGHGSDPLHHPKQE